jgi:hypothetical protein
LWIIIDERGWCLELIWGDMWIGTDDIWCSLDQLHIAMCIGMNVTGSFHDNFDVPYDFEHIILDDVLTKY